MLVNTPFSAVTKVPIEVCAAEVSALMVKVVGVLAAEALVKFKVTPLMAPDTTLLGLVAAKPLIVKLASWAACVCVRFVTSDDKPPSPPDVVAVMALAAPVAELDSTNREPSEAVRMLAVTPGLFGAALIAAAIPASVLSFVPMAIEEDAPLTVRVRVPVPIAVLELATGAEVRVAEVAKFLTSREYWPAAASEDAVAEAMVVSPTVASYPARVPGVSSVDSVACNVSSALVNVP